MCTLIRSYVTNMTHFTAVGDMVMMWIVYRPQRPSLIISSYRSLVCCSHWPICRPTNRIRCRPDKKKLSADMSVDKNVSGDMSTDKSALLLQSFSMSMFTAIYTSADCRTAFFLCRPTNRTIKLARQKFLSADAKKTFVLLHICQLVTTLKLILLSQ